MDWRRDDRHLDCGDEWMTNWRLGFFLLALLGAHAGPAPRILFVGLKSGGAPAFEQSLERQIRRELTTISDIRLAGHIETRRVRRYLHRQDPYTTSEQALASLDRFLEEPSALLWGAVHDFDVHIVRRRIFGAAAVGSVSIALSVLDTGSIQPRFLGLIHAEHEVALPPIGFSSIDKKAHLAAPLRSELLERLTTSGAGQVADLLGAVARSWSDENDTHTPAASPTVGPVDATPVSEPPPQPTVTDLFDIPGMDSAPIIPGAESQQPQTRRTAPPEAEEASAESEAEEAGQSGTTPSAKEQQESESGQTPSPASGEQVEEQQDAAGQQERLPGSAGGAREEREGPQADDTESAAGDAGQKPGNTAGEQP